jgi:hypothetical protein
MKEEIKIIVVSTATAGGTIADIEPDEAKALLNALAGHDGYVFSALRIALRRVLPNGGK